MGNLSIYQNKRTGKFALAVNNAILLSCTREQLKQLNQMIENVLEKTR